MAKIIQFDPKKRAEEEDQKKEAEIRKKCIASLIRSADKLKW